MLIRGYLDKISKIHVYFKYLRLDWYERLDKFVKGEFTSARSLMPYKEITHIPMNLQTMKKQIKGIFNNVLDELSTSGTVQSLMASYYSKYEDGLNSLDIFEFKPQSTNFERVGNNAFCEVLYPKNFYDMLDFFLRELIKKQITFKVCKSCGKYFPATGHGNSEYCNRLFLDAGKTCKEIGSLKMYQAKIVDNPEHKAYSRAYKTHFAWIKYKRMTKDEFRAWAELARKYRDEVTAGKMSFEQYQEWLGK